MKIKIALVDDHIMLRNGLADMLTTKGFNILFQASNGKEFIDSLMPNQLPQIVLMDINMPIMDGFETTNWITKNYEKINVIALSMYDDEISVIKMIRAGARGYILKYAEPTELVSAIKTVFESGFYYTDLVNFRMVNNIMNTNNKVEKEIILTDKEKIFLQYCCSDLTYKEIADKMFISPKTVENYREQLCLKIDTHTRVGLVMYAIKIGLHRV